MKEESKLGGQLTIFVSMILLLLFAFIFVLLESARTAGARWYLQTAASSAMDSVFSQYHRDLWDYYRLLFAEYEKEEELEADFTGFLEPYLETDNWYPMKLEQARVEEMVRATDGHGAYLEKEILDYMKYGIWNLDFQGDDIEKLRKQEKEAEAVTEMANTYRTRTKDVWKLERVLESISENLNAQKEHRREGLSSLSEYDGAGFRKEAEAMISELEKIPGLVKKYEAEADKFAEKLNEDRKQQEDRSDQLSEETKDTLDQEIEEYESYVVENGKRRQEICNLDPWSLEQINRLEELIDLSYEVEREIEEWESDDEDDEEPDYESLWSPVRSGLEAIKIPALSFVHGVKDKEKEGWLKEVEKLYQEGMLSLLVPKEHPVSEKVINKSSLPSTTETYEEDSGTGTLLDHLMVNEYCGKFFTQFCSDQESEADTQTEAVSQKTEVIQKAGATQETEVGQKTEGLQGHVLDYEVEYLICGKESDRENLSGAIHRLLAVRSGLNLIHILSDSEKRNQAKQLATLITGVGSISPLILVTTFFIMSIWALGEALMDVKGLLAGKKVVLLKTADDWTLKLENLLQIGKKKEVDNGGGEKGLAYLSWLKILLVVEPMVRQDYRIMDVIQLNLGQGKSGFRMHNAVYQVCMSGDVSGKHLFYSPAFVENVTGRHDHGMTMTLKAERRY